MSEVLLIQHLGLEDDWLDPDDIANLPAKLPKSGWHERTVAENFDLKAHISSGLDLVGELCLSLDSKKNC